MKSNRENTKKKRSPAKMTNHELSEVFLFSTWMKQPTQQDNKPLKTRLTGYIQVKHFFPKHRRSRCIKIDPTYSHSLFRFQCTLLCVCVWRTWKLLFIIRNKNKIKKKKKRNHVIRETERHSVSLYVSPPSLCRLYQKSKTKLHSPEHELKLRINY